MSTGFEIERSAPPSTEELTALYDSVGWSAYTSNIERLEKALRNSSHLVTAREAGRLVGLARCVSDDTSVVFVQDILVDPQAQRQGIGRALLQDCLDRYEHVRQKVLLTDDRPDQLRFYKSLGFANTRELVEMPINAFVIIGALELC